MYFDKNQIDEVLLCEACKKLMDQPKILPCHDTICSLCEKSIQILDYNKYNCLVCKEIHEMPKNGLPFNKALLKMLSIKPTLVSRGKAFETIQKTLDQTEQKYNYIKRGIENSNDLIKEHFMDQINSVQISVEEIILQIKDKGAKLIKNINEYEQKLILINKTRNKSSLDEFQQVAKKIKTFHTKNIELLSQHVLNDEIIIKSNEEAINLNKEADTELKKLKDTIFLGQYLTFEKNKKEIDEFILGKLKINEERIASSILPEHDQINDLISLCGLEVYQNWTLIYRASQDGFEAAKFHSKCDKKLNTLIIVKSTSGNVFGGYTEQSWSGIGFKLDSKSFIFSLINRFNKPLKMKWSQNQGIDCNKEIGPVFGRGGGSAEKSFDIYLTDKSNTNISNSNLGCHPDYKEGSNEA